MSIKVTWLGYASLLIELEEGDEKRIILMDPLYVQPTFPSQFYPITEADIICVSHGHADHIKSVPEIALATGAQVIANYEACIVLEGRGCTNTYKMNKGGTYDLGYVKITQVSAEHSSVWDMGDHAQCCGAPTGYVLKFRDGRNLYFSGDTTATHDMQIISDLYEPKVAFLPIGGNFTMGPREAAYSLKNFLKSVDVIVPIHYHTFPYLDGSPDDLEREMAEFEAPQKIVNIAIGERTDFNLLTINQYISRYKIQKCHRMDLISHFKSLS